MGNTKLRPWLIDVPVAVNFFVRPDTFDKVFNVIKEVRPRQLFLIADGPRTGNPDDIEKCKKCREIAENIDWDCEVYRFYNEKNKGLFHTYFDSMTEVFKIVDRCIFLEDDVIADQSFFQYCKYLLDKYAQDNRISFVTGINYMPGGVHKDVDSDYFFSGEGALQAYGLWRRTFQNMRMDFLSSKYSVKSLKELAKKIKPGYEKRIKKYENNILWQGHLPHVEVHKNLSRLLYWQLCIVPKYNLVTNIGLSTDSTHSADTLNKIPRAKWCIYNTPVHKMQFPMMDPKFMICDVAYEKEMDRIQAWDRPFLAACRRIEAIIRHLLHGDSKRVLEKIKQVVTGKYIFDE